MNDPICIDPTIYYNTQLGVCESPEPGRESIPNPAPIFIPPSRHLNSLPPNRRFLNLRDYSTYFAAASNRGPNLSIAGPSHQNPLVLGLFNLVACNSGVVGRSNERDASSSADSPGETNGITSGEAGTTVGTNIDTEGNDSTGDTGSHPIDPFPGNPSFHDTLPCGREGFTSDLDETYGVCTNYATNDHHLFQWNPSKSGEIASLLSLSYAPDQVLRVATGEYFITHYGNTAALPPVGAGLAVVNTETGFQLHKSFPSIALASPGLTSAGSPISQIKPSQPKGLVEVGNRIYVATSNGVVNLAEPSQSYYNPGTVLIYDRENSDWFHNIRTTDFNPTGILYRNNKIYVVNSGDINASRNPVATSPSSVDVIDPGTVEIVENIPLGTVGAGIHGELAISSDGKKIVLATGDNSGRMIVVDLESKSVREIFVVTGGPALLTGVSLHESNQFAYVGNFNDGNLYTVDLESGKVIEIATRTLDSDTGDAQGISDGLVSGGILYVGLGSDIFQLPLTVP